MLAKGSDGKPKGKVYVIWNKYDKALASSYIFNRESRLGKKGPGCVNGWLFSYYDKGDEVIHDDFKEHIDDVDTSDKKMENDKALSHSYQLDSWCVQIYEEMRKNIKD